jgi:hypothetical protein
MDAETKKPFLFLHFFYCNGNPVRIQEGHILQSAKTRSFSLINFQFSKEVFCGVGGQGVFRPWASCVTATGAQQQLAAATTT